jgi:hypothetical protein
LETNDMRNCFAALLATLLLAACQAAPNAPAGAALTGSWGGQHIGLELSATSGRLDYDCAAGTIDEPVRPDASGRFTARGTHTPSMGGPERVDVPRPQLAATYTGRLNGDRLTLSVRTPDAELGPFTLARGAEPVLLRCL